MQMHLLHVDGPNTLLALRALDLHLKDAVDLLHLGLELSLRHLGQASEDEVEELELARGGASERGDGEEESVGRAERSKHGVYIQPRKRCQRQRWT